jgi:hypothetical protein
MSLAPARRLIGHPLVYASELSDATAEIRIVTMFMCPYRMFGTRCVILHVYYVIERINCRN